MDVTDFSLAVCSPLLTYLMMCTEEVSTAMELSDRRS